MGKIITITGIILIIMSCDKDEVTLISDLVKQDRYYQSEIFSDQNIKIYGKWEFLYAYGGIGGTTHEPSFDYLEIVKYGIYGIINNNKIKEIGRIEIISQDDNQTIISFLKDEEYSTDLYFQNKVVLFTGNDTLSLGDNMDDGYISLFKRIK
jgi:hypothetical protein